MFTKDNFLKLFWGVFDKIKAMTQKKKLSTAVRQGWPPNSPKTIRIYMTVAVGSLAEGSYVLSKVAFTKVPSYRIAGTDFSMTEEQWACLAQVGFLAVAHSSMD